MSLQTLLVDRLAEEGADFHACAPHLAVASHQAGHPYQLEHGHHHEEVPRFGASAVRAVVTSHELGLFFLVQPLAVGLQRDHDASD